MAAISRRTGGLATAAPTLWFSTDIAFGAATLLGGGALKRCRQVFEPCITITAAGKRTGCGLATVHSISTQHQAELVVDSARLHALFISGYADPRSAIIAFSTASCS